MGRPRIWESNADRMRAYRDRLAADGIPSPKGKLTPEERAAREDVRATPCQECGERTAIYRTSGLCKTCYDHRRTPERRAPWPGPCAYLDGEAFENGEYALLQTLDPVTGNVTTTQSRERLTSRECFQHLFETGPRVLFGYGL